MSSGSEPEPQPERPLLRVVRGAPDAAEIAALVAVLSGLAAASTSGDEGPVRSAWLDRAALVRAPLRPGRATWRASVLPR